MYTGFLRMRVSATVPGRKPLAYQYDSFIMLTGHSGRDCVGTLAYSILGFMQDHSSLPVDVSPEETAGQTVSQLGTNRVQTSAKDPAAVALGRRGGLLGGPARAKALSKERRKEIARKAALARWRKKLPAQA